MASLFYWYIFSLASAIEDLYNEHHDYVQEILMINYIFNEDTCVSIYQSYNEIFSSPSEVKLLVLGMGKLDDLGQRPLSKLTRDIMQQFEGELG